MLSKKRKIEKPFNNKEEYQIKKWKSLKRNAIKRNLDFSLLPEDIIIPDSCPVFNKKFKLGKGGPRDNSPSVDRIDNTKGYHKDNIIVVSYKANRLKSDAKISDLMKLVKFYANLCKEKGIKP